MDKIKLLKDLGERTERELMGNILPVWMERAVDRKGSGFIGGIDINGEPVPERNRASVINARILWTFSSVYLSYPKQEYLDMATRAYDYLFDKFWDKEYGGMYWILDCEGKPFDTKKQVYAQAFAIYALCEYYRAKPDPAVLDKAKMIYKMLEEKTFDKVNNGYFEVFSREWGPLANDKMLPTDVVCDKSMNTHLHVLEAYTNLYRVWKTPEVEERLRNLIRVTVDRIVDAKTGHFIMFFDKEWNSKVNRLSYGHDIEGSWLLYEAAEILGDEAILKEVRAVILRMADAVRAKTEDTPGIINEVDLDNPAHTDNDYVWWVQAEAVVGFLNAYELSGDENYLARAYNMWKFVDAHFVDDIKGEWFRRLSFERIKPKGNTMKADEWKAPYHNGRMCLEVIARTKRLLGGGGH